MKKPTPQEVLALPMGANDADAETIGGYLRALLLELWTEGEGFSGKRPFGNSGWEFDLYRPLVEAGFVAGEMIDGYAEIQDRKAADAMIAKAIAALS